MRGLTLVLALCMIAVGCGTGAEWSPKYPKQPEYPQVVQAASRVRQGPRCPRIGVVHADGDVEEVVPALAREAAEHGGTDYTIEDDKAETEVVTRGAATRIGNVTYMHARSSTETTRYVWAIVYRCKDDARTDD